VPGRKHGRIPVCTALFILGLVGGRTLLLIRGGALLLVFRPKIFVCLSSST
jgi:hypothetical protein